MPGTGAVKVSLDVMNDEQRTELRKQLRGDSREPVIPFAQPGSLTRVYAVASGKGGVGKSSVTVNLAAAMAARGLSVGVLDADIYGHSVPRMMGTTERPTQVESMILPPVAHDVRVISIAMFTQGNTPVVWRGPMLHRALQQFLADVYWGDLDVLLLDLPPGTGDIAISVAQLIPGAEILVVTTPQLAAAEVAERAGAIALQTRQRIVGVVENMSGLLLPDGTTMQIFGEGGGKPGRRATDAVGRRRRAAARSGAAGSRAGVRRRRRCAAGVVGAPDSAAGKELRKIADATVEPQAWPGRYVAWPGSSRALTRSISATRRGWHHRARWTEQVIRIALTVFTPILTAGIGIVALVIGDWRERRTQARATQARLRRRQQAGRFRGRLVERQQADRRLPRGAAARRRASAGLADEASDARRRVEPPRQPKRSGSITLRRLLLAYPMHRRGARILRGFYYFFLGCGSSRSVGRWAPPSGRTDTLGVPNYFSGGLIYADLIGIFLYDAHRDGISFLVAARGGICSPRLSTRDRMTLRARCCCTGSKGLRPASRRIVFWLWMALTILVAIATVSSAFYDPR